MRCFYSTTVAYFWKAFMFFTTAELPTLSHLPRHPRMSTNPKHIHYLEPIRGAEGAPLAQPCCRWQRSTRTRWPSPTGEPFHTHR